MVSHDLHVALGAGCAELIKLHVRQPAPPAPHPQPEAWPYNTPMPAGLPRLPEGAGNPAHGRAPGAATAATLGRANEAAMLPPGWRYARFGEPPADLRGMNIDVLV